MRVQTADLRVMWLREAFPWMGVHSGYDCLCRSLEQADGIRGRSVWRKPRSGGMTRARRALCNLARATHFYSGASLRAEIAVMARTSVRHPDLIHLLYTENALGFLRHWRRISRLPLVTTAHQPPSWWVAGGEPGWALGELDAVIAVSGEQARYLSTYLGDRVHFVPHGVDTGFFTPDPNIVANRGIPNTPRFVFVGVWLRDLVVLEGVISAVLSREPGWQFDLIIPVDRRDHSSLSALMRHPQVHWHAALTDEQLRAVYRQSTALLLPLTDCTCNNAVLEAMACGLPVISNRVGGMPDYVTNECACLVPPGDVDGLTTAALRIGRSPVEQAERGRAAREHAVRCFDWRQVAQQTMTVYRAAMAHAATQWGAKLHGVAFR